MCPAPRYRGKIGHRSLTFANVVLRRLGLRSPYNISTKTPLQRHFFRLLYCCEVKISRRRTMEEASLVELASRLLGNTPLGQHKPPQRIQKISDFNKGEKTESYLLWTQNFGIVRPLVSLFIPPPPPSQLPIKFFLKGGRVGFRVCFI